MAENKLPHFDSLQELAEFFDSSDMGKYWEGMSEAHFDVAITKRTRLVAIEETLAKRVEQAAKEQNMSPEALIQAWLEEKLILAG
jgi:hypothetical protein